VADVYKVTPPAPWHRRRRRQLPGDVVFADPSAPEGDFVTDPLADLARLPGVFEAVDAARGAVDALLREVRGPALRHRVPEVTAESLRRAARASTLLETGDAHPAETLSFGPPFAADATGRTASGALRVCTALSGLARTWSVAPLQALARLHALAAADLAPPDELGRPRPEPGLADRLGGLAGLVTGSSGAPAVVVAAVVHGELLCLAPFGTADGVVARAASRLVLLARGLDPLAVSIPEEGHLRLGGEYAEALRGYRSGHPEGVGDWVVHCATAVALGARAGRDAAAEVAARQAQQPTRERGVERVEEA
jgi:hypothetical protein